jgi:hypothetical protein
MTNGSLAWYHGRYLEVERHLDSVALSICFVVPVLLLHLRYATHAVSEFETMSGDICMDSRKEVVACHFRSCRACSRTDRCSLAYMACHVVLCESVSLAPVTAVLLAPQNLVLAAVLQQPMPRFVL